jgi:hypothetical protein
LEARLFSFSRRLLWPRHQARCFARRKVMSWLTDFMSVRLTDDATLLAASDSLNGKCGENGRNTATDIRVQT